jgi:uncharacterized protein (DUF305 family)
MKDHASQHSPDALHYRRLIWMLLLSFISMYVLMYSMVDRLQSVYMNINQVYMAGLMTAPMALIELAVMAAMYPNRKLNAIVAVSSAAALALCWTLIRQQTAVSDAQFLRSMIPHHAGAILMCNEASIQHVEIRTLCQSIVAGQQREIDQMRAMLNDLSRTP